MKRRNKQKTQEITNIAMDCFEQLAQFDKFSNYTDYPTIPSDPEAAKYIEHIEYAREIMGKIFDKDKNLYDISGYIATAEFSGCAACGELTRIMIPELFKNGIDTLELHEVQAKPEGYNHFFILVRDCNDNEIIIDPYFNIICNSFDEFKNHPKICRYFTTKLNPTLDFNDKMQFTHRVTEMTSDQFNQIKNKVIQQTAYFLKEATSTTENLIRYAAAMQDRNRRAALTPKSIAALIDRIKTNGIIFAPAQQNGWLTDNQTKHAAQRQP